MKLTDMLASEDFLISESEYFYGSDSFLHLDEDLLDRIESASEYGADGRTHAEVIDYWYKYANDVYPDDTELLDAIVSVEDYHERHGTLYEGLM